MGVTSCNVDSGYWTACGTSMASPTACGVSALIMQDWRARHPGAPDFRNSTLKVILAHSAVDLGNPGPDYQFGYGSIRAEAAILLERSGNVVEHSVGVGQGETSPAVVVVNPGDPQLKTTLAWDDVPGNPNVTNQLVNDLDLLVTSPSGVRHYPWTLAGVANPSAPAVRTQEDHVNNSEQVVVDNPEPGTWIVQVRGTTVPSGPQPFSLAGTPMLVHCSDAGTVSIGASIYNCSSTATLRVIDCGLNTSDTVIDTTTVLVTSPSQPAGQMVTLTEILPAAATFVGTVRFSPDGAPGTLRVAEGDTVTMTYVDANDGAGHFNVPVTDTAVIDCTPAVISNVTATSPAPRSITISFNSSEPTTGLVRFGTSCGGLTGEFDFDGTGLTHSAVVVGLQPDATYFFEVIATDAAGNVSIADNNGNCFTFATPPGPEFFTQLFSNDNNLAHTQLTFTPAGSPDFYVGCARPASSLPVDPASGVPITFPPPADDAFVLINLPPGRVSLYGVAYNQMYVGTNGYITFATGDSTRIPTLTQHFNRPRISVFFDDLACPNGTVSYTILPDRVAVTYNNVLRSGTTQHDTMQVEMFRDGRVRSTYLDMASTSGVAGLSRGGGQPAGFEMSNLIGLHACGPRPPLASAGSTNGFLGASVPVQLFASDEGQPQPLSYIISSLPAHGRLIDPNGGRITQAPYTLLQNGSLVTYRPLGMFTGQDSFQFKANDGGTPPSGGDSNTAAITVAIAPSPPPPAYQFLTGDADPIWFGEGLWAFGTPTGGGTFNHDPTSGYTGQNVLGYNLAGNYSNNMPAVYLTSSLMNLTNNSIAVLQFRRWLGIDASQFDQAAIEVTANDSLWTPVWVHDGAAISESAWSLQTYDITNAAANQPRVRVRWRMGPTNGTVTYPGWNLDDITILSAYPNPSCPCDWNGADGPTSQDFFDFMNDFFAGDADFNNSGATDSQDFFDFLTCFFAGCP